jgi:uncharacterized membrane protein
MTGTVNSSKGISASWRLLVCALFGVAVGTSIAASNSWRYGLLGGWDSAACLYVAWIWSNVWHLDATATKAHALREDTGRTLADVLLVAASLASLVGVTVLITQAGTTHGISRTTDVVLALLSVVVSWATIHTTFGLKYARIYYGQPEGGISFNERQPPRYSDFAYLAFTIGMAFQVSDTALQSSEIRRTVLKHSLLAYVFGVVIIATTINTISNLSH